MHQASLRVCVVGAGVGGLAAAALLAARGAVVTVLERDAEIGGKARFVPAAAGITMRDVFAEILAAAGGDFDTLAPTRLDLVNRHIWPDGAVLDLGAESPAIEAALGAFAGAGTAQAWRGFAERAQRIWEVLAPPFVFAQRPSAIGLATTPGVATKLGVATLQPLWQALGTHFEQPRPRQVFARAAAYIGCSPLLAPATLMMITHIERQGVWQVQGGMLALARALAGLAEARGAAIRCNAEVAEVTTTGKRATGLRLAGGETLPADAVLVNADAPWLLARSLPALAANARSFSAITWPLHATDGVEALAAQTVFLPDDPTAEYTELHYRQRLPARPTVQVAREGVALTAMVSAPSRADTRPPDAASIAALGHHVLAVLAAAGVRAQFAGPPTTPADFARAFPGNGGAIYGPAIHGWGAAFQRPAARSPLAGLYLCGGGTHPGAGVAMAAVSARLAVNAILQDRS